MSLTYVSLNFIGLQNNFWTRTLYKYYIYEKKFEKYQQSILSWVPPKYEINWINSLLEIGKFVVEHLHILLIIHKTYHVHIYSGDATRRVGCSWEHPALKKKKFIYNSLNFFICLPLIKKKEQPQNFYAKQI